MKIRNKIYALLTLSLLSLPSQAAQAPQAGSSEPQAPRKAWEIGLGGTLANLDRVTVAGTHTAPDYNLYNLKVYHLLGGGHLYLARELAPWLYADLQGSVGIGKGLSQTDLLWMGGLGLQLRPFTRSHYVEPFLRVGINYAHRNFSTLAEGRFADDASGFAHWNTTNTWNPNVTRATDQSFIPLSFGAGVHAWLDNHWGIGLQGEYLLPLESSQPRYVQGTLRLMYRIGGRDKRPVKIEYVEVDRPVDRIVEKIVYVPAEPQLAQADPTLCELFNNINFEFDKDVLTPEAESVVDLVASILKQKDEGSFLITGFTDTRGSDAYNMDLSMRRARRVTDALIQRGVASSMLKYRGVGKRTAAMGYHEPNDARLGDRKVTIEKVTNSAYWDRLP